MTDDKKRATNLPPHLRSVEDYYSWGSQCNSFAPKFAELTEDNKRYWAEQLSNDVARHLAKVKK